MYMARLGWTVRRVAALVAAPAAVFAAGLVAAPLAEAHGGVSIGIGFGFGFYRSARLRTTGILRAASSLLLGPLRCLWTAAAGVQAPLPPRAPLSLLLLLLLTQ